MRARKFPGLISGPTIDWFLPCLKEALVAVSQGVIKDFPIECTAEIKEYLMVHMGMVHKMVTDVCDEYFIKMRRQVYQTPKSYLSFIQNFKGMYMQKFKGAAGQGGASEPWLEEACPGSGGCEGHEDCAGRGAEEAGGQKIGYP